MVGGAYEALELDDKRSFDMGTMLALNTHKRGEGAVKPGSYVFVPEGQDRGVHNGLS